MTEEQMVGLFPEEGARILFIWNRDGLASAYEFAVRGYKIYRAARKIPYGKSYRRKLVLAAWEYRRFSRKAFQALTPS